MRCFVCCCCCVDLLQEGKSLPGNSMQTTSSFQSPSFICDACCCGLLQAQCVPVLICLLPARFWFCFWFFPVTLPPPLPCSPNCRTTTVICCISNAPVFAALAACGNVARAIRPSIGPGPWPCASYSAYSACSRDFPPPAVAPLAASIRFRRGNLCSSSVLVFNFPACFSFSSPSSSAFLLFYFFVALCVRFQLPCSICLHHLRKRATESSHMPGKFYAAG